MGRYYDDHDLGPSTRIQLLTAGMYWPIGHGIAVEPDEIAPEQAHDRGGHYVRGQPEGATFVMDAALERWIYGWND
jgi:hypothetical protein